MSNMLFMDIQAMLLFSEVDMISSYPTIATLTKQAILISGIPIPFLTISPTTQMNPNPI